MKTQIIQLSQNEDAVSVREKISWSQSRRILLVWPSSGRVLAGKLELSLVARHAASLGSTLALVTRDAQVRDNACQLGLSVFDHPRAALNADWLIGVNPNLPSSKKKFADLDKLAQAIHEKNSTRTLHPAVRIVCLSLSLLALIILGIYILPGATITISPQVQIQSMLLDLSADPSSQVFSYATGNLPTYTTEVIVNGHDTMAATGSVTIPDKPATGSVSFTNLSDKTINIPVGTIVSTAGIRPIRFITTFPDDVNVLPDDTVVQPVRAIQPGLSGNLPAFELSALEGAFSPQLLVTNLEATSGGSEAVVPSPSALDVANLRQSLQSQLLQDARIKLQSSLPEEDILIAPTVSAVETITETIFPAVGDPGNQLVISLTIRVHAQAVSSEMVKAFITPIMDAHTPQGYAPAGATLAFDNINTPIVNADGKAHWTLKATRQLQVIIPAETAASLAAGKTKQQASDILSAYLPVSKQASIMLSPSWWPRLPILAMRIEVVQENGQ